MNSTETFGSRYQNPSSLLALESLARQARRSELLRKRRLADLSIDEEHELASLQAAEYDYLTMELQPTIDKLRTLLRTQS